MSRMAGYPSLQTDKQRRSRPAKPYCEAFPALSVLDAVRNWYEGQRICEWTNEHGLVIGHIILTELTEQRLSFEYRFFGTANVEDALGDANFAVQMKSVNPTYRKASLICKCKENAVILYFVSGKWLCKNCHGLCHLSNRLTSANKKVLERDDLARRLNEASEKEQHKRTYLNSQRTLIRLNRELATTSNHLPTQLRFRSFARWLEGNEIPKLSIEIGELGYGWEPGQATGLDIFRMPAESAVAGTGFELSAVDQSNEPFLYDSEVSGNALFENDLRSYLLKYFADRASEAAIAERKEPKRTFRSRRDAKIKRAASIEPLVLEPGWMTIARLKGDGDSYELRGSLRFSGNAQLFFAGAAAPEANAAVRATIDDDLLSINVRYKDGDEKAARVALDIVRKAIWDQIQAQAPLLQEYRRAVSAGEFHQDNGNFQIPRSDSSARS